jgi:TRAP-type mannitol/chloroaromatic compound transport system substrate-binding protein
LAKLYESLGANVVSFPYGPMPTQPLGWFQEPVASVADLEGLRFRTVGLLDRRLHRHGGRGQRAARRRDRGRHGPRVARRREFNNASSDQTLGFADVSQVAMLQSFHQNAEQFEIMFNKARYDALP